MVRESGISATRPIFPNFLLPGIISLPFRDRRRSSASSASAQSPTSTVATTPDSSPHQGRHPDFVSTRLAPQRLSRVAPDTLRCSTCSADIALASQIVSKGFTGRHGRAFLVAPGEDASSPLLLNVRVGKNESRQLVTGWHVVADIMCSTCNVNLGWKYVDAKEPSQKYKVGKYILETERVMTHRSWEHTDVQEASSDPEDGADKGVKARVEGKELTPRGEISEGGSDEEIEFDSDDDDECEDIFAGTWDRETVARRRRSMVAHLPAAQ